LIIVGFLFLPSEELKRNEIQATSKSRKKKKNLEFSSADLRRQAERNVTNGVGVDIFQSCTEPPSSWCSTNGSFRHSDSSLYPDSLNQETSSVTGTTKVEFIIGSPTRRFRQSSVWPHRYFDSIDSAAMLPESLLTDEFSLRRGEALAECDSLECHPISNDS
ncbi:unnamed protein product, partial [Heterotrigona itama]